MNRLVIHLITTVVAGSLTGCVSGSLASDTGPVRTGERWSAVTNQLVHVGETVQFDFVLSDGFGRFASPSGVADYCVARIGSRRIDSVPDPYGHFNFSYTFDQLAPGETVDVSIEAFRQNGARDFVEIGGQWVATQEFSVQPDTLVARDTLKLTGYQSVVAFDMPRPPDDFDTQTGVLRLRQRDGTETAVYVDRSQRKGFSIAGPEPSGFYRVRYEPRGNEVAKTGETEVVFTIYDVGGQRHSRRLNLSTP